MSGRWATLAACRNGQAVAGLWGIDKDNIWAVGELGTILKWNGAAWVTQNSGSNHWLYGMFGSPSGDVWAVGDGGAILYQRGR